MQGDMALLVAQVVLGVVVAGEETLLEAQVIHRHHLHHRMQTPFKVMLVAILRN
jgi:hypothetical protein